MYGRVQNYCLILAVAACVVVGCEGQEKWDAFWGIKKKPPADVNGRGSASISVDELSRRLGLEVSESSSSSATLIGRANTVVIVADPGGGVYVNGKTAARSGPIHTIGGVLCVQASVVPRLRQILKSGRSSPDVPKTVGIAKTVQPDQRKLPVVVVDAGHGGSQPGAERTYDSGRVRVVIQEKALNLDVALEVTRLLKDRGVRVVATRIDDSTVSLDKRVQIANETGVKLMVSVHSNAEKKQIGSVRGSIVFVGNNASARSLAAAKRIEKRLAAAGVQSLGVRRHPKPIRVLVKPKCPSVLVEMGFMSNPGDLSKLMRPDHRLLLARAIAEGILDFLKEGEK